MQRFTSLFDELDATMRTGEKLDALRGYFSEAPPSDAAWALALLSGGTRIRALSSRRLRDWVADAARLPHWLLGECYDAVGDLAETLALLLPDEPVNVSGIAPLPLHELVQEHVLPLAKMSEREQRELVLKTWRGLTVRQRFLYNKMLLGNFRVGVAGRLVVRALAQAAGVDASVMAHRLSGRWAPTPESFLAIMRGEGRETDAARPYPFCLAHALDQPLEDLGRIEDWQAEWKWDGIRAQLIHRPGHVLVWSRGDELITHGFPEIASVAGALPAGTVLDGEILAWEGDRPLPFSLLQRRINRKREEPRLWDEVPVVFMAFDLLEEGGSDLRVLPLQQRRERLTLLAGPLAKVPEAARRFHISPVLAAPSWEELRIQHAVARERSAEGIMLKRRDSAYGVGRERGGWWKWKVNPYTIDAVLIYAQLGNGKRASIFTDYTFGLWEGGELVPVAKAYSGLTDEEILEVDAFVRRNTVDRHGPVRVVKPQLVFELAFENIQESTRHRSGLAVRFPRMARWRRDKRVEDADTVDSLRMLLPKH